MVRRSRADRTIDAIVYIGMGLVVLTMLYPFWELLVVSLMTPREASQMGFKLWPSQFFFENYIKVLQTDVIYTAYFNTIVRTMMGVAISVVMTFSVAYPLSNPRLPLRKSITGMITFTMFFSGGLIPTYLLVRSLGLIDTRFVLVFVVLLSPFHIFMVRNFIMGIPDSLEESATIDGASYLQIMTRIIIPVCKPILATLSLWLAVLHWNSWFDAMIYTPDARLITLQLYLRNIIVENTMMDEFVDDLERDEVFPASIQAVNILLAIGPIVLIYPFIQKYFVLGTYAGSVKG